MHSDLEKLIDRAKIDHLTGEKLDSLPPGTYCLHTSWGAGRVVDWDRLTVKVKVDFEDKPGHELAMKFAAKTLTPLTEDHFYARRVANPDDLKALAKEDPVDLVRLAVASSNRRVYLDKLEEMLKGKVIDEGKYKSWWESTKKKLREDRRFVVPSKRSEPLELRDDDLEPSEALIGDLISARDLKGKVKAVDAIIKDLSAFDEPATQIVPVIDDINDSAGKGIRIQFTPAVELILARGDLLSKVKGYELSEDAPTVAGVLEENPERVAELLEALSLTRLRQVLNEFPEAYGEENWRDEMLGHIPPSNLRTITEIAKFVADEDNADAVIEYFEKGLQQRTLSSDALAWICKERNKLASVIFDPTLSLNVMSALEADQLQEETAARAANRLRDLIASDAELIPDLIKDADINTVRNFASRLMGSASFDELTRKSLMARVVKIYPQIQDIVSGGEEAVDETMFVSNQSLEKRKADYEKLVKDEIPKNREDISIARSYGDLRENFEYKSAKEYQRVLLKRKADWERDLKLANPFDFSNPETDAVNLGTVVKLEATDGGKDLTYTILGAWDSDPDKGIIAYLSRRGQILLESTVGEDVALPTGEGETNRQLKVTKIDAYSGSIS